MSTVCNRDMKGHLVQPTEVYGEGKNHVQGFESQKRQDILWGVKVIQSNCSRKQKEDTIDLTHNRPFAPRGLNSGTEVGQMGPGLKR